MDDDDECGAVGGMSDSGNRSTRRKPAPFTLCPPQIPHDLTWARTWASADGSRRLIAWAMVQLHSNFRQNGNKYTQPHSSCLVVMWQGTKWGCVSNSWHHWSLAMTWKFWWCYGEIARHKYDLQKFSVFLPQQYPASRSHAYTQEGFRKHPNSAVPCKITTTRLPLHATHTKRNEGRLCSHTRRDGRLRYR
jgi:hypothetical protein